MAATDSGATTLRAPTDSSADTQRAPTDSGATTQRAPRASGRSMKRCSAYPSILALLPLCALLFEAGDCLFLGKYRHPSAKPGNCPKIAERCMRFLTPRACNNDGDCNGARKCCALKCSIGCTDPAKEQASMCPLRPKWDFYWYKRNECKCDSDCSRGMKCCGTWGKKCMIPSTGLPNIPSDNGTSLETSWSRTESISYSTTIPSENFTILAPGQNATAGASITLSDNVTILPPAQNTTESINYSTSIPGDNITIQEPAQNSTTEFTTSSKLMSGDTVTTFGPAQNAASESTTGSTMNAPDEDPRLLDPT